MKTFDAKNFIDEDVDLNSYISKLIKEIREDQEVYEKIKSLGLTNKEVRDNISKLAEYKDDYNYCKSCPGLDKCDKENVHLSVNVRKEGQFIINDYQPCHKLLEKIKKDSLYLIDDFPNEWKEASLKSLDLAENRRPLIKEFSQILAGKSEKWIYIIGNHRVGKSYVLVTFANEFVECNLGQVAVFNCPQRVKELADLSYKDKEQFSKDIDVLCKVPLLVLDDFGNEYKNEYIRDQIIIPILSERAHQGKLTFFSSEFLPSEIQEMYSIGKSGGNIRGKQLAKILDNMSKVFDITGIVTYKRK